MKWDYLNAQEQRKIVWPPSFAKARAFVDQLERSSGLPAARVEAVRTDLASAEKLSGAPRQAALRKLATQLTAEAPKSSDAAKARMLVDAVKELAAAK